MANILVTGGAGYIGSHCCRAIAAAGHVPIVYDNYLTGHAEFVRWGEAVEGDVRDGAALARAMETFRPAAVMHFAALSLVGESVRDPGPFYDVNVGGTLRILEAMRKFDVGGIVFSSTCAVYGDPDTVPITEESRCDPVSPYGSTKLACERMMDEFGTAHGIRSVRLRYFNAAGAAWRDGIGERHDPETHLVPLVIDAALGRRGPVSIFGTDYPSADGTAIRDYIHVNDLASAHVAALGYLLDGGATQVVNVGTGSGTSVAEIVSTVERIGKRPVPRQEAPRRAGDPPTLVADAAKAGRVLGWKAEHDISTIVEDAWEWHRSQNS